MTPLPVTEAMIRQHSTPESFARGQTYAHEQAVGILVRRGNMVQAEVAGSEPEDYLVTVVFDERGAVEAQCTCPYDRGGWCKHIVATLLSALRDPAAVEERTPLPTLLAPLDRDTLQSLLLQLIAHDPVLAVRVEAQIGLQASLTTVTGAMPTATPVSPPAAPVPVAAIRHTLHAAFRGAGGGALLRPLRERGQHERRGGFPAGKRLAGDPDRRGAQRPPDARSHHRGNMVAL